MKDYENPLSVFAEFFTGLIAPQTAIAVRVVESIEYIRVPNYNLTYVYALQCEETGNIKIGVAEDWRQRIKSIQSMSPTKLELVFCIVAESRRFESYLHRKLSKFRIHGEWFTADKEVVELLNSYKVKFGEELKAMEKSLLENPSLNDTPVEVEPIP